MTQADAPLTVRFHGVRGSYPVPASDLAHYGGNTSCVEVESGPFRVVLDCGTGAIRLGQRLCAEERPVRALVLLSHLHHDHTMGWPFFKPVYQPQSRLHVHGPASNGRDFRDLFEATFTHPFFPVAPADMASTRTFGTLAHGDVLAWNDPDEEPRLVASDQADGAALLVRVFRNRNHPNGGVLNYRVESNGRSVVMATDIEGSEGEAGDLADFASGTDLLIHDAQYTEDEYPRLTRGWGHSTWRMAADVASRANARRLVLYHHDPAHDDGQVEAMERLARQAFPRAIAACEGLEIHL